jgi:hypothetical protein
MLVRDGGCILDRPVCALLQFHPELALASRYRARARLPMQVRGLMHRGTPGTFLAATALAAMASCYGCGESSPKRRIADYNAHVRVYGTTPRDAANALARLKAPPGFKVKSCPPERAQTYTMCFVRRPSTLLDKSVMEKLVAATGTTPWLGAGAPIACFPRPKPSVSRLSLEACHANVSIGAERLTLFTTSLVLASPTTVRSTKRSRPGLGGGTEVTAEATGHFLHEGVPEEAQ